MTTTEPVSSPNESLILVNQNDESIGVKSKAECHTGAGILHRAFSIFLLNDNGDVLLQQRSKMKPLWPLFWSNSCCSHPREGEITEDAVRRRVREELQLDCDAEFLYKFEYSAAYEEVGTEHELCHVFIGRARGTVDAHPDEIAAWRYLSPSALTAQIAEHPAQFTPWLKLEWARITSDFADMLVVNDF